MVGEVLSCHEDSCERRATMIVVTHEMAFARDVSTRVIFMDKGYVEEDNSPDIIFNHPEKARTREFLSRVLDK